MSQQFECLYCHKIHYVTRLSHIRKFCDSSHAAKYNNARRTKASRDQQQKSLVNTLIRLNRQKKPKVKKIKPVEVIHSLADINIDLYPKTKPSVIKYTAQFLNKNKDLITYADVELFKNHLEYLLYEKNLSPTEIKEVLDIKYTDFGMFMKKCMGIELKNLKEAINNYNILNGRTRTDKKEIYWIECAFSFDVFLYPLIPNYELLFEYKWYHPVNNPNGLNRDHMISKDYGWRNNIDPKIISHPANCAILFARDNFSKNNSCSITLDNLLERIKYWNDPANVKEVTVLDNFKHLPKTDVHKRKISIIVSKLQIYTDGIVNLKQDKNLPTPAGFRKGMIRHKT